MPALREEEGLENPGLVALLNVAHGFIEDAIEGIINFAKEASVAVLKDIYEDEDDRRRAGPEETIPTARTTTRSQPSTSASSSSTSTSSGTSSDVFPTNSTITTALTELVNATTTVTNTLTDFFNTTTGPQLEEEAHNDDPYYGLTIAGGVFIGACVLAGAGFLLYRHCRQESYAAAPNPAINPAGGEAVGGRAVTQL